MESTKGRSSTRSRETKRDHHPTPTQKDAYARLLSQHQSTKFQSYLEQFAQPSLLIHDGEAGPQRTTACSPGDKNWKKRGPYYTECADSCDTSRLRQNEKEKCMEKSSRQEQSPAGRKLNHENLRDVMSGLDGIIDLDEGSHQGSKQKCEYLNQKGSMRRPNTDEDITLGSKCKSQQSPDNDANTRKDQSKKKTKKKNISKANAENKMDQAPLSSENDGVCEASIATPIKNQKPQGIVFLITCDHLIGLGVMGLKLGK